MGGVSFFWRGWGVEVGRTGSKTFWINEERIFIIFPANWEAQAFSVLKDEPYTETGQCYFLPPPLSGVSLSMEAASPC